MESINCVTSIIFLITIKNTSKNHHLITDVTVKSCILYLLQTSHQKILYKYKRHIKCFFTNTNVTSLLLDHYLLELIRFKFFCLFVALLDSMLRLTSLTPSVRPRTVPLYSQVTPHSGYHWDGTNRRFFEGWYFKVRLFSTILKP